MDTRTFHLDLAGQDWSIEVSQSAIDGVHRPLLALMNERATKHGGRFLVFVAGPPGSGKTTLCALWESLAAEDRLLPRMQTLPLDGFHFTNEHLAHATILHEGERVPLRTLKGFPETFDVEQVRARLREVRAGDPVSWPFYDRNLHEPVQDAITVAPAGVLLVEGNYLLLDEPGWREIAPLSDLSMFIESAPETLKDAFRRLLKGGRSWDDAMKHHRAVDQANYRRIMDHRLRSDITLVVSADRSLAVRGAGATGVSGAA